MGLGLRAAPFNGAAPRPIPGGFVGPGGKFFHIEGAPGTEPSSITDFNGVVGIAVVDGTWTSNGPVQTAPLSFDTDMRFMDGEYIGVDGKHYQGSFALIWIDLYVGPSAPDFVNFSNQVHDFDPGIAADGLFWTVSLPPGSVRSDPGSGVASLVVNNQALLDYHDIPNALLQGPSHPATVSFVVNWRQGSQKIKIRNPADGFAAELVQNNATMAWSAVTQGVSYFSGPENTSFSVFAYVGHERNGVFFPQGEG
jgi:hypothetical protein